MCVDDALHDLPCHLAVHMHMSFVLCPGGGVTSCLDPPAIDLASCHWVAICLHGSYSQGNSATITRFTFYLTIMIIMHLKHYTVKPLRGILKSNLDNKDIYQQIY